MFSRNSSDGYMHDFFIDNGAVNIEDSCSFLTGDTVMKLRETLTKNTNLIFFDSYFNFIELSLKLAEYGFISCGTIRRNRLRRFQVNKDAVLRKKGRGSHVPKKDATTGVTLIQGYDNKYVLIYSNFLSVELVSEVV